MKQLKITVPDYGEFIADFLDDEAPKTCKAIRDTLPYENIGLGHAKWSGCVMSVFSASDFGEAENSRGHGVWPGDILFNPHVHDKPYHPCEISIVYGEAAMRTFSGYAIANLFARVRPEYLSELRRLGDDISLHGYKTATLELAERED